MKALTPVKWDNLSNNQKATIIRSYMFLKEKFEVGVFTKLKARLVADGWTQDQSFYSDYSLHFAKTWPIMACLKLTAMKNWEILKLDV